MPFWTWTIPDTDKLWSLHTDKQQTPLSVLDWFWGCVSFLCLATFSSWESQVGSNTLLNMNERKAGLGLHLSAWMKSSFETMVLVVLRSQDCLTSFYTQNQIVVPLCLWWQKCAAAFRRVFVQANALTGVATRSEQRFAAACVSTDSAVSVNFADQVASLRCDGWYLISRVSIQWIMSPMNRPYLLWMIVALPVCDIICRAVTQVGVLRHQCTRTFSVHFDGYLACFLEGRKANKTLNTFARGWATFAVGCKQQSASVKAHSSSSVGPVWKSISEYSNYAVTPKRWRTSLSLKCSVLLRLWDPCRSVLFRKDPQVIDPCWTVGKKVSCGYLTLECWQSTRDGLYHSLIAKPLWMGDFRKVRGYLISHIYRFRCDRLFRNVWNVWRHRFLWQQIRVDCCTVWSRQGSDCSSSDRQDRMMQVSRKHQYRTDLHCTARLIRRSGSPAKSAEGRREFKCRTKWAFTPVGFFWMVCAVGWTFSEDMTSVRCAFLLCVVECLQRNESSTRICFHASAGCSWSTRSYHLIRRIVMFLDGRCARVLPRHLTHFLRNLNQNKAHRNVNNIVQRPVKTFVHTKKAKWCQFWGGNFMPSKYPPSKTRHLRHLHTQSAKHSSHCLWVISANSLCTATSNLATSPYSLPLSLFLSSGNKKKTTWRKIRRVGGGVPAGSTRSPWANPAQFLLDVPGHCPCVTVPCLADTWSGFCGGKVSLLQIGWWGRTLLHWRWCCGGIPDGLVHAGQRRAAPSISCSSLVSGALEGDFHAVWSIACSPLWFWFLSGRTRPRHRWLHLTEIQDFCDISSESLGRSASFCACALQSVGGALTLQTSSWG